MNKYYKANSVCQGMIHYCVIELQCQIWMINYCVFNIYLFSLIRSHQCKFPIPFIRDNRLPSSCYYFILSINQITYILYFIFEFLVDFLFPIRSMKFKCKRIESYLLTNVKNLTFRSFMIQAKISLNL